MPRNTRPKTEAVTLEQIPPILSEWRHMARSRLLSDRQLYAAALAAYEAYRELKGDDVDQAASFASRVKR